jgi:hypothetical protein
MMSKCRHRYVAFAPSCITAQEEREELEGHEEPML